MSKRASAAVFIGRFTNATTGARLLIFVLLVTYAALPLGLALGLETGPYYVTLALVTAVAVTALALGAITPLLDPWFSGRLPRVVINAVYLNATLWSVFIVFVLVLVLNWLSALFRRS